MTWFEDEKRKNKVKEIKKKNKTVENLKNGV
jgi:hypothetical protein